MNNENTLPAELAIVEVILIKRLKELKEIKVKADAEGGIGKSVYDAAFGASFDSMIKRMNALIECGES